MENQPIPLVLIFIFIWNLDILLQQHPNRYKTRKEEYQSYSRYVPTVHNYLITFTSRNTDRAWLYKINTFNIP